MAEFNLAFPKLIKWAINQNQYAESEKDAMAGYVDTVSYTHLTLPTIE